MIAAWLVYSLLVGGLLGLFAFAIEGVSRQSRLASRWSWLASIALAVALTAVAASDAVRSRGPLGPLPAETVVAPSTTARVSVDALGAALVVLERARALITARLTDVSHLVPPRFAAAMLLVGSIAALGALMLLALVHLRLRFARRRWPVADLHGQRVRIAPAAGPAVIGLVGAEIVVPRWLLGRAEHEQRLVIAHEREHLRAHDHLALAAGALGVALMPWNPAMWWMLRRLRLAIELDCDARVLRRGVLASTYGTTLIDLADQCTGFRLAATALAEAGSHLERRILAMNTRPERRSMIRLGALCAAGAIALLAACEAKVPTAAEIDALDVAGVQRNAQLLAHSAENTVFYVDGKQVDARTAHALTANQISTVSVEQGMAPGQATSIRIATTGEAPSAVSGGLARLHSTLHGVVSGTSEPSKIRTPAPDDKIMSGLILVDGKRVDRAAFSRIAPATIKTVNILKGRAAADRYGPEAVNGAIVITTTGQ